MALWHQHHCLHVVISEIVIKIFVRKCKSVSANELHLYTAEADRFL